MHSQPEHCFLVIELPGDSFQNSEVENAGWTCFFFVGKKQEILLNCGMGQKMNSKSCLLPKKLTSAATASQQFCVQDWVTS